MAEPKPEKNPRRKYYEGFLFPMGFAIKDNPRREGTHGFRSLEIIRNKPGISYEEFKKSGGRSNDLNWDIQHGRVVAFEEKGNLYPAGYAVKNNPKQKGTRGHQCLEIIRNNPGLSIESYLEKISDYLEKEYRKSDLEEELNIGNVVIR